MCLWLKNKTCQSNECKSYCPMDSYRPRATCDCHFDWNFEWSVIWDVTDKTTHPSNIFEKYPEVTKIYDMFCLCTHHDYRGKGLGTEMVRQSWKMAKKAGCDASVVWASSNYSRKIFVNLGMTTMHRIAWEDLIYDGQVAFKNVDSDCITSHFIKL